MTGAMYRPPMPRLSRTRTVAFTIQPEDNGNMVDTQKLSDYTVAQMREGNNTIQMADSDCYKKGSCHCGKSGAYTGTVQQDRCCRDHL